VKKAVGFLLFALNSALQATAALRLLALAPAAGKVHAEHLPPRHHPGSVAFTGEWKEQGILVVSGPKKRRK